MVENASLTNKLKCKSPDALKLLIQQYTGFVSTVVYNIIGSYMHREDIEEVVADVFMTLWQNTDKLQEGHLHGYIACISRSKAKNKLREYRGINEPLDDELPLTDDSMERLIERNEQASVINSALAQMNETDRNIFIRHYYYYQKITEISAETGINPSTVKTRLARGRQSLKEILNERGYDYED